MIPDRLRGFAGRLGAGLTVRRTALLIVLLAAVLGTGVGFFDPFGTGSQQGLSGGNGTPPTTPPPAPTVTVTPPGDETGRTTTERAGSAIRTETAATLTTATTATTPATTTATATTAPSDPPESTSTATGSGNGTGTTARTPSPNTTEESTGANASVEISAEDPPTVRNDEGRVPAAGGVVSGTLQITERRVDSVVLVLQVWVPSHGWTVRSREAVTSLGDGDTQSVDIESVFGYTTYADQNASAFRNVAPDTVQIRRGAVRVIAVLFDGSDEIGRVSGFDVYDVTVENTGPESSMEFDLTLEDADTDSGSDSRPDKSASVSSAGDTAPGSEWSSEGIVGNEGDSAGQVILQNISVVSFENGLTDPEQAVDSTGGNPGAGAGELAQYLRVRIVVIDATGDRNYVFGSADEYRSVTRLESARIPLARLRPGENARVVVEYRVADAAGNEIQSDSVVVDFGFTMVEI